MRLSLILTHQCDLACSYCYAGEKSARDMPLEVGEQALERAFATLAPDEALHLGFFGGEPLLAWAAGALLVACCLGETLSRPMLEAIALQASDPLAEAVARQILRDEHLHATFGWEALEALLPELSGASRARLQAQLTQALGSFERSTACGIPVEDLVGREINVGPGEEDQPNLGTLSDEHYAAIFFATIEHEILPGLAELGFDAQAAWAARPR